jgi:DNA-binding GntR family transcriptional regulator
MMLYPRELSTVDSRRRKPAEVAMEELFGAPASRVLREDVAQALRDVISNGRLKPGDRIVESAIAEQMGISRAPVREAIRQLAQEGLIETTPRRGTVVTKLSEEGIWEIYSLRSVIEGFAARLAARRRTAEQVEHLQSLLDGMRALTAEENAGELVRLDLEFHSYISIIAGHARLGRLHSSLVQQIATLYHITDLPALIRASYGDASDYALGHNALLRAIREGRAQDAEMLAREHVAHGGERLAEMLRAAAADEASSAAWDELWQPPARPPEPPDRRDTRKGVSDAGR